MKKIHAKRIFRCRTCAHSFVYIILFAKSIRFGEEKKVGLILTFLRSENTQTNQNSEFVDLMTFNICFEHDLKIQKKFCMQQGI